MLVEKLFVLFRPLARGVQIICLLPLDRLVMAAFYRLAIPLVNVVITLVARLDRLPLMTITCYGVRLSVRTELNSALSNRRCPQAAMTRVSPLTAPPGPPILVTVFTAVSDWYKMNPRIAKCGPYMLGVRCTNKFASPREGVTFHRWQFVFWALQWGRQEVCDLCKWSTWRDLGVNGTAWTEEMRVYHERTPVHLYVSRLPRGI